MHPGPQPTPAPPAAAGLPATPPALPPARGMGRFVLLDMLRGLAALWIFTTHLPEYMANYHPQVAWFATRGYLAVMTFFIISGYAVTASLHVSREAGESVTRFMHRRLRRIYMPLWLAFPVMVPQPWLATWLGDLTGQAVPLVAPFLDWNGWRWLRFATLFQIYWNQFEPPDFIFPVFTLVLWTLAVEVQFYVVMFLAFRWTPRVRRGLILLSIVSLPLGFFVVPGPDQLAGAAAGLLVMPKWLQGWLFAYWPVFGMGMLLFLLDRRGWTPATVFRWPRWVSALPLVLLPCTILATLKHEAITASMPFSSSQVALWLWFWMDFKGAVNHLPRARAWAIRWPAQALLLVGHMSYTIYLLHLPLRYTVEVLVHELLWPQSRLFAPTLMLATLAVCFPFYWFVERPFAKLPLKPAGPPRPVPE